MLPYHPTTTPKQKTPAPALIQDGAFFAVGPVGSEATSGSCTSGVVLTTNMMLQKKSTWSPKKRPEMLSHKLFIWVCMYTLLGTGRRCPRVLLVLQTSSLQSKQGSHVLPGFFFVRATGLHSPRPWWGYFFRSFPKTGS